MTHRSPKPPYTDEVWSVPADRLKRILPVADHEGKCSSEPGVLVRLRIPVPSAFTTHMSRLSPVRVLENTSFVPSGDHAGAKSPKAGNRSTGSPAVMLRNPVPSAFVTSRRLVTAARASNTPSGHWQRTATVWLNASFVPSGDQAGSPANGLVTCVAPMPLGNAVATPPGDALIP